MKKSLGLIETEGLAAGIEAADAAVKSANVELIGYELTKGGGWTTVKVQGDVGAVKAAVDAARMAAAKVNRVVSTRVIPRPSAGLDMLVHNPDTVGDAQPPKGPDTPNPPQPPEFSNKVNEEVSVSKAVVEDSEAEESEGVTDPKAPEDNSKAAESDGVDTLGEKTQDAADLEAEEAEVSSEQEAAVLKPAKRTQASKGRKVGKRSTKHETTE